MLVLKFQTETDVRRDDARIANSFRSALVYTLMLLLPLWYKSHWIYFSQGMPLTGHSHWPLSNLNLQWMYIS